MGEGVDSTPSSTHALSSEHAGSSVRCRRPRGNRRVLFVSLAEYYIVLEVGRVCALFAVRDLSGAQGHGAHELSLFTR